MRIPVGGAAVADRFMDAVGREHFPSLWHQFRARELCARMCHVPLSSSDAAYQDRSLTSVSILEDAIPVQVPAYKLHACSEPLLNPSSRGMSDYNSIAQTIFDSFNTLDGAVR